MRTVLALVVLLLCPSIARAGGYCELLTIDHTKIPNTDQSNFPLLVHGTYWWMADIAHSGFAITGNGGHDIRFYSDSGCTTALDFQRVYWTNTTGDSSWRVRIATASHTTNNLLYVKIGDPADTTDLSTLWMGTYGYVGVYAGGDPASVVATDSGSAGLTLSCGANTFAATSPVGGGFFFDTTATNAATCGYAGSTVGETLASHGYPVGNSLGHIRMWIKQVGGTGDINFGGYGKANGTGQRGFEMTYDAIEYNGFQATQLSTLGPSLVATNSTSTPTFTPDLNWHLYDFDYPSNGATFGASSLYIDGIKITAPIYYGGSSSSTLNTDDTACCTNQAEVRIGRAAAHGVGFFNGYLAQFEVTNTSLSADNVVARFNNESSPATFYSFTTNLPARAWGVTLSGIHAQ